MRHLHRPHRLRAVAPAARAARQLTWQTVERAKRSRRHLIATVPLTALVVVAYATATSCLASTSRSGSLRPCCCSSSGGSWRETTGARCSRGVPAHGSADGRDRGVRRPATVLVAAALVALRLASLRPQTLAVGGAITAVIFGLAAQQTLGHLIAGLVLISARPFRVGDRVRLHAGGIAGEVEGRVASLGLLYTTLAPGRELRPRPEQRRPERRRRAAARGGGRRSARASPADVKPSEVQRLLEAAIRTPVRAEQHIGLEGIDSDEVVVRIAATPEYESDGPQLADEILGAIAGVTRELGAPDLGRPTPHGQPHDAPDGADGPDREDAADEPLTYERTRHRRPACRLDAVEDRSPSDAIR